MTMTPLTRRSPVDDHPLLSQPAVVREREPGVTIALRPQVALLQVTAFDPADDAVAARLAAATFVSLPEPNQLAGDDALNVRSTGPGIWQIAGDAARVPKATELRARLEGLATVVDLGHARAVFRVKGADAARTINKHCGLDLDPKVFTIGAATNTRFNQLGMTLARLDDERGAPVYELMVFRGYAVFVLEALFESAREFGGTVERIEG